jgi:predicted Zn-dependent protease
MTTVTLPPRPVYDPRLLAAASAMNANRLPEAEPLLRALLREDPFDVRAIRLFAELAGRIGRYGDAENLLRRAIELDPAFTPARANLALVLYRTNRAAEALDQLAQVTREDPDNPSHANLAAAANGRIGAFDAALALYEKVLADAPAQPRVWMSYGHMLKTVGRQADGIAAYRRALALMPGLGRRGGALPISRPCAFRMKTSPPWSRPCLIPDWARKTAGISISRWARPSRTGARRRPPLPIMPPPMPCAASAFPTRPTRPPRPSTR